MLRQDADREVIEHRGVGRRKGDLHRMVAGGFNRGDVLVVGGDLREVFGVEDRFQRELYVGGGKRFAVVPFDPLPERKGIGEAVAVVFPLFRQPGDDPVFPVTGGQSRKEQQVHFPVLIERGVDARIIPAAIDEGRLFRFPARRAAARQQKEDRRQQDGQKARYRLLHVLLPSLRM